MLWDFKYLSDNKKKKGNKKAIKVSFAGFLFHGNTPVSDIWKAYQGFFKK